MSRFVSLFAIFPLVASATIASPLQTPPSSGAAWGFIRLENVLEASDLGISNPGPMVYDAAAGALVVTDDSTGRAKQVGTQGALKGTLSRREAPQNGSLTARDSRTGYRYTFDSKAGVILETDEAGALVSRRDVANVQLRGVAGMAAAPTSDTTDAAAATSLYVSVANASDDGSATGPGVVELALTAPAISLELAGVPDNVGHLVKTIDANNWDPFSPDPSGIAYDTSRGKLVVSDGEIEEEAVNAYPYPGSNVWEVDRVTGAGTGIMDTTVADPVNREPVGVAYDRDRDELYISKDGGTSRVWAYTRVGTGWEERDSLALGAFGAADAEGLAFWNNRLFVADGSNKEVWVIGAGPDNQVATDDDVLVSHFDTAALGMSDPEGIGVDPNTGHLWMVSHKDGEGMLETLQDGTPVSTTHFDFATDNPGGLEIASSSSSSDPSTVMSAWVAQRGVDNNSDPNEKDGKLHEVSIDAGSPPPPPPDPGDNLLVNGDFEDGTAGAAPPGWTANANFTTSSAVVRGGSFSGRHSSSADAGYTIEQTVPAAAGQTYSVSTWANPVPTADAFRVVFKIQFRTNSKALTTTVIGKVVKTTAAGWDDYVASLVAPAGTTKARVFMVVSSLRTQVYVDDISLAQAP